MHSASLLNRLVSEYRLVDFLGAGGMGEVYRGVHTRLGRVVAVKVLSDTGYTERFLNEARIQAGLQHENIARLYEFVKLDDRLCIIMEYVDGHTLHDEIYRHGTLKDDQAMSIFRDVVSALSYMHKRNIVHRDLKPNNIKIRSDGVVKLLDFGIAKGASTPKLTRTGHVIGTLEYIAPEQIGGHTDVRSDIWSLGILLYEMVTGHAPFEAENVLDLYDKIRKANYVQPSILNPSVSVRTERIIARCLKKNPDHRYASATALYESLTQPHRLPSSLSDLVPGHAIERFGHAVSQGFGNLKSILKSPTPSAASSTRVDVPSTPSSDDEVLLVPRPSIRPYLIGGAALILLVGLWVFWPEPSPEPEPVQTELSNGVPLDSVRIDAANTPEAWVQLENGETHPTPYTIKAERGTRVQFVLKADGYRDRQVDLVLSPRRNEYIYTLDKQTP